MTRVPVLILAGITAVATVLCGCDGDGCTSAPVADNQRAPLEFVVGAPNVSYLYRHPTRGLHSAEKLDMIPLEHRVAVIVITEEQDAPALDARRFFVADLLDARVGRPETAVSLSKEAFVQRNLAASMGHERADRVRFWAQEVTQLSPNSERARSSDRALRLLEELPSPKESPPSNREDSP
jgi:hypothetical protein